MTENSVFKADNKYRPERGEPPQALRKQYYFSSYFENRHGDQLLFVYDKEEKKGYIYNGREGWVRKTILSKEQLEAGSFNTHFSQYDDEQKWIEACIICLQAKFSHHYDGYDGDDDDDDDDGDDDGDNGDE